MVVLIVPTAIKRVYRTIKSQKTGGSHLCLATGDKNPIKLPDNTVAHGNRES